MTAAALTCRSQTVRASDWCTLEPVGRWRSDWSNPGPAPLGRGGQRQLPRVANWWSRSRAEIRSCRSTTNHGRAWKRHRVTRAMKRKCPRCGGSVYRTNRRPVTARRTSDSLKTSQPVPGADRRRVGPGTATRITSCQRFNRYLREGFYVPLRSRLQWPGCYWTPTPPRSKSPAGCARSPMRRARHHTTESCQISDR